MKRVLIVGCGYVGIRLGAELVRHGHEVWGARRSGRAEATLEAAGIRPLPFDLTAPGRFPPLQPGYDWVVNCAATSGGGPAEYERLYFQGTHHLLAWLSAAPPSKYVYTSSTSVYAQDDGSWVDEESPTAPQAPTAQVLARTEAAVLGAVAAQAIPGVVLRLAGIYGPGRTYYVEQVRSGAARLPEAAERMLNMVHQADVAGAIHAALERGEPGRVYNVVDDEPVAQSLFFKWLAARLECPPPPLSPSEDVSPRKRGTTNKRVSNRRLKTEVGYQFRFPTFRQGYEDLLASPQA